MTYEEFKGELYRSVSEQDKSGIRQVQLFEKGDEGKMVREDFLCVQWGRQNPLTRKSWNIRTLYEKFKKEGWQGILPEIMGELCAAHQRDNHTEWRSESYIKCSEQLIVRPLNYRLNREELADCIYWKFGDMALVLYTQLGDVGQDYVTMKVRRSMTEKWNVPPKKMLTNALLNSYAKMPPRLFLSGDIRFSYDWEDGVFMPRESGRKIRINPGDEEEGIRGYRLTTTRMKNGAIAIFYPGVQSRLAELLKGDYLVGFTSIHEVVIHPACHKNPNDMKSAIRHINAVFDEQDMLTNSIYRYCRKRGKLLEI